jgi:hypothetical protein
MSATSHQFLDTPVTCRGDAATRPDEGGGGIPIRCSSWCHGLPRNVPRDGADEDQTPLVTVRTDPHEVVRFHCGIDTRLHWRLDFAMNEDNARNQLGNGPQNLVVLRHMTQNVMQKNPTKGSLRGRLNCARWGDTYLSRRLAPF